GDFLDVLIVDQISKQRAKISCDLDLCSCDDLSARFINHRINIKLQSSLKHPAQRLQDSAFQIRVIFFVQDLDQTWHAHDKTDCPVRVTKEIRREPIIFAKLRD